MKTLVVFAALMIVGSSAIASQSTPVTPSSKFSEIIRNNKNTDHIIQASVMCFKTGEQVSGMNKICYYNCLGSTAAITISSVSLCPLSINR